VLPLDTTLVPCRNVLGRHRLPQGTPLYLCVCLRPIARGLRVAWQVGATVGGKLAARRSATDQCSSAEEGPRAHGAPASPMHSSTP
jgi:hypothetical protein